MHPRTTEELVERWGRLIGELEDLPEHLLDQVRYSEPGLKLRTMLNTALQSSIPPSSNNLGGVELGTRCKLCGTAAPASFSVDCNRPECPHRKPSEASNIFRTCDWPEEGLFSFRDEKGEHDPCYVVMPGGAMLPLNHHAGEGVDIARAKFIIAACNRALGKVDAEATAQRLREALETLLAQIHLHDEDGLSEQADCVVNARAALQSQPSVIRTEGEASERSGLKAMSADIECKRTLNLHFDHEVSEEDRQRIVRGLNALIKPASPSTVREDALVGAVERVNKRLATMREEHARFGTKFEFEKRLCSIEVSDVFVILEALRSSPTASGDRGVGG